MPLTSFCGVSLPQVKLAELETKISNLESNAHKSLYFLYSEFLIRAERNLNYKQVLKNASITAIDGRGLEWTNQVLLNRSKITNSRKGISLFFRAFINIFTGIWVILLNQKIAMTNNEVILGRNFIYYLFEQANLKKYKIAIIGGNQTLENNLKKKFPDGMFKVWQTNTNSNLMRDIPEKTIIGGNYKEKYSFLNQDNLFIEFPGLLGSINFLESEKWDYIFVTIGGASGKQEFLCNQITSNPKIKFRLVTGIGAALDHLGGNNKQKQTPKILEKLGLEWLFRIITNPRRVVRILDSVLTLWWLTSMK